MAVSVVETALLLGGAYLDDSYQLGTNGVGLAQHPGIFSVVWGDFLLFVLVTKSVQMSKRIGAKLPNKNKSLVRRYFRLKILNDIFSGKNYFFRIFIFMFIVGLLALINQSVKLFDPAKYYGHDTFDSALHPYSFAANRINLFISWCIVMPMFFSYLLFHMAVINRIVSTLKRHFLLDFYVQHPDKSGGYSFFGFLNILYMAGILIVLLEVFLLA